jgi:hypothetical protein
MTTTMLAGDIFGLPIPDAGPVSAAALVIHILSGLTAVTTGALAATAKKRPGRHPRAGRIYLSALGGVFTTATIMAIIRWHEDAHLLAIAVIAFSLGLYGYQARRRHRPGWPPHHAIGMGGSYIALLTGFYVDNGLNRYPYRFRPFLRLWNQLPHVTYWLLPTIVGAPLIWLALNRFRRIPAHCRPGGDPPAHRLHAKPTIEQFTPDISDQAGLRGDRSAEGRDTGSRVSEVGEEPGRNRTLCESAPALTTRLRGMTGHRVGVVASPMARVALVASPLARKVSASSIKRSARRFGISDGTRRTASFARSAAPRRVRRTVARAVAARASARAAMLSAGALSRLSAASSSARAGSRRKTTRDRRAAV